MSPNRTPTSTDQPRRPPNAWILYRSEKSKILRQERIAQGEMSKRISAMWKAEGPQVRAIYEQLAEQAKAEHLAQNPGYKYQPKSKDIKEQEREARIKEKELKKEQQRRGQARASPSASTPAPQPAYQYMAGPSTHPLEPYLMLEARAQQRHGSQGPTPPQSASASRHASAELESSSVTHAVHASSFPQTPSSSFGSPAPPPPSYPVSFDDSQFPEPDVLGLSAGASEWKDPQSLLRPSLITTIDNWSAGEEEQEFLTFDVPGPQMNDWATQSFDFEAFLSATNNPSVFELNDFDPAIITSHPTGQLEVSLGDITMPFEEPIPDLADFALNFSPTHADFGGDLLAPGASMGPAPLPTSQNIGGNFNAEEFPAFVENSAAGDASRGTLAGDSSSSTTRPYVPPAGASNAASRRVGGRWNPPSYSPQSPTSTSWGVHA